MRREEDERFITSFGNWGLPIEGHNVRNAQQDNAPSENVSFRDLPQTRQSTGNLAQTKTAQTSPVVSEAEKRRRQNQQRVREQMIAAMLQSLDPAKSVSLSDVLLGKTAEQGRVDPYGAVFRNVDPTLQARQPQPLPTPKPQEKYSDVQNLPQPGPMSGPAPAAEPEPAFRTRAWQARREQEERAAAEHEMQGPPVAEPGYTVGPNMSENQIQDAIEKYQAVPKTAAATESMRVSPLLQNRIDDMSEHTQRFGTFEAQDPAYAFSNEYYRRLRKKEQADADAWTAQRLRESVYGPDLREVLQPTMDKTAAMALTSNQTYPSFRNVVDLSDDPDYAELSVATKARRNPNPWTFWDTGDGLYDYINDIDGYRKTVEMMVTDSGAGNAWYEYSFMNDGEIRDYNYLYAKHGKETAEKYLENLMPELNWRRTQEHERFLVENADKYPVGMSIVSVPAKMAGGVVGTLDLLGQNINRAFTGRPVDYYTEAQQAGRTAGTIRGAVTDKIEDSADWKIGDINVAGLLYNGVMGVADTTAASFVGGGSLGTTLITGADTFGEAAREVADRGGTDNQALVSGIVAVTMDNLFDKVDVGNFSEIRNISPSLVKSTTEEIVDQAGIKATQGSLKELAETVYDTIALGDASKWQHSIEGYMLQGMSEQQAKTQTVLDIINEVIEAGAEGMLKSGW